MSSMRYTRNFNYNASPIGSMENNYKKEQDSDLIPKNIQDTKKQYLVNIDSGDRDSSQPLHYNYYIKLPNVYHNVCKVEMVSASFPNSSGITTEPYIVFDIKELNCISFPARDENSEAFALLPIRPTSGSYINPELGTIYHVEYIPEPTITLSRLTIKIKDCQGQLYNFGVPNGSFVKADQHSFMLKITVDIQKQKK